MQNRNWKAPFFTIWIGQQFSLIGSMLVQFALVWWLTQTTGSATILATATMIAMLPEVLLGPFAGALVDRSSRRKIMILADSFVALGALVLVYLFWSGQTQIWHIYAIMLARSLGGMFHWPAMQASTTLMVPKEQLTRVSGINQSVRGAMNIVAPPLGALLLTMLPMHGIMAIDIVTALLAITPLFFVAVPQPQRAPQVTKSSLLDDVRVAVSYVWHWQGVMALLVIAMLLNFLIGPAFTLLPLLVTKHFGGGALQLGWLNSAWGVGLVLGGLILGIWGGFRRRIYTCLIGIVGLGIGVLVVGLTPAALFPLALGAMLFAGGMNSVSNGAVFALIQGLIAPEMQGRVFMVTGSLCSAMMPLSMAVAGPVADALGVRTWYLIGGIGQTLIGLAAFLVPAILHIEENHKGTAQAAAAIAPASATAD
jgi:DHA3 family macrolide efflux protein-like MFS transporter